MAVTAAQLDAVAKTLSLVTNDTGPVEPGRLIEAEVISSLADLSVVDLVDADALPVPVPESRPVELEVEWAVLGPGTQGELKRGVDYLVSADGIGPAVGFLIKPQIIALRRDRLDQIDRRTLRWTIRARVHVRVGSVVSEERELTVVVQLLPIEIPVLAALFRHDNYQPYDGDDDPGFVLLVVPEDSPLRSLGPSFNDVMERLDAAVRPLRSLAGIGEFLLGLEALRLAAAGQPLSRVHAGNVSNLKDIHMRVETFLGFDMLNRDLRAHDRVTAMIVLGPERTRVGCYDDENFALDEGEWAFHVRTGPEMVVLVPDLDEGKPPRSEPQGRIRVVRRGGVSFSDNMSSIRFDPPEDEGDPVVD